VSPRLAFFVVAATALFAISCGTPPASQTTHVSPSPTNVGYLSIGSIQRVYVTYRPPSAAAHSSLPLVIALHGYTVGATWMETNTHFDQLADQDGFEVVYPQGEGNAWNAGRCCGHASGDDVAFIRAVIDELTAHGDVDRTRVYVAGMSNGAFMAQRLACELADRVTAVASVSGSLVLDTCAPSRPVPVLEIHGVDDDIVPLNGGMVAGLTTFPPTMSNMKAWAKRDSCAPSAAMSRDGIASIYTWSHCRGGVTVVLEEVAGVGHTWFSPDDMPGEPDASKVAWAFFQRSPPVG